jgi:hypothetical protein
MARYVVLPSITDVLRSPHDGAELADEDDDAACALNEEEQHGLLMRAPPPPPTAEERKSYAAFFPEAIAKALSTRKRRAPEADLLFTVDELNAIAPVFDAEAALSGDNEEDEEEEAPRRVVTQLPPAKKHQSAVRPRVIKELVQRAVETADVEYITQNSRTSRRGPYEVYARSKFPTQVASGEVQQLSTLRLAIYRVFLAGAQKEEDKVDAALEVLELLVTRCGVDPDADDAQHYSGSESLLSFVSSTADTYAFADYSQAERRGATRVDVTHVRVLRTLLKAPTTAEYLTERKAVVYAVKRLAQDHREACVVEVLEERGEYLTDRDVFKAVAHIMAFGTRPMLRCALQALDDDDRVPPTLRHPRHGYTLLHFAAREFPELEALVRPYSDASLVDHAGCTAAHYSAERAAQA